MNYDTYMRTFSLLLLFALTPTFAETPKVENDLQEKAEQRRLKVLAELEKLQQVKPQDVPSVLPKMRNSLMDYISINNKICRGEFSVVIFGKDPLPSNSEDSSKPKRLDWKERKACLQALDSFRNQFSQAQKTALLKYFDYIHEMQRKKFLETYESFKAKK